MGCVIVFYMKKLFSLIFILILGLSLTGCTLENKKSLTRGGIEESLEDDSLETDEDLDEIDDDDLKELEAELDELEEEINQL